MANVKEEQWLLYNTIEYEQATPNITQAKKIRYLSERIEKVLPQEIKIKAKDEIEKYIIEAIKEYKKSKT